MALVSMRGYAKLRGVSPNAVSKAVKSGRISLVQIDGKKLIDSEVADREWDLNSDATKKTTKTRAELEQEPKSHGELDSSSDENTPKYSDSRAIHESYKARMARLEYQEKLGELVSAEEVKVEWTKLIVFARTKILGIPSKVKSQYSDIPLDALALIEEICRGALEDLASGHTDEDDDGGG